MNQSPLSASVIGGGVGGRLSLNALRSSPQFSLVAAADLKSEIRNALERDFPGLKTFASHEQMLSRYPTDVVCVSTYAPSHEPVVRDVLRLASLRGILVEKPSAIRPQPVAGSLMPQGLGGCPWWCHTAFGPGQRHWRSFEELPAERLERAPANRDPMRQVGST
jgi:GFO/IDH/MocA oxidoreductase family protein